MPKRENPTYFLTGSKVPAGPQCTMSGQQRECVITARVIVKMVIDGRALTKIF